MSAHPEERLTATLGRGMAAGLAGTVVMTAFQKLVEMPLTGRADSYAPADLAEKLLPLRKSEAASAGFATTRRISRSGPGGESPAAWWGGAA